MSRIISLYTLEGVPGARCDIVPFCTEDKIGLTLTRFSMGAPTGPAVLLLHGLTQSSDMFIMPEHENLVRALLASGINDVWCLDSRMSNRFAYNGDGHDYTLDDVALFDHPAAVHTIRQAIGDAPLHVIGHCMGSVSFSMSLFGNTVRDIASFVSHSVSLTPQVPLWSRAKLGIAPELLQYGLHQPHANPRWHGSTSCVGKLIARAVSLAHPECNVPACHMLSMMWGAGKPATYRHENLLPITHERIGDLHGVAAFSYYRHIRSMVRAGAALTYKAADPRYARLPKRYLGQASLVTTPILFTSGSHNRVFGGCNADAYRHVHGAAGERGHRFHAFAGYGHSDVFIGKDAARDVFPTFIQFIVSHSIA